ncbi:MAG: winged helix-turn-helix domain-containing protein [Candidatus Bathyarchaeota archaeon]|nr:winged helix-turn-helix domain-containing protein [Candidatus Bathyarchaeota archaeon]
MRDFLIVKDPKVAKLFADSNRRDILHNLRHREMTACQLAKMLGKNVSSISYHLSALEEAGLVEQSRTSVKGNLVEKFYSATAQKFIISYTLSEGLVPGSEEIAGWSKEVCEGAVKSLGVFGYDTSGAVEDELLGLIEKYSSLRKVAYEKVISQQKTPAHVTRPALRLLISVLTNVRLYQNPEYIKTMEKISAELRR